MDFEVESVQVHVEGPSVVGPSVVGPSAPGTPSNEVSALSTSVPSVWATPASFLEAGAAEVDRGPRTPGTPSNEVSVVCASTPALWATPAEFAEPEKVYSFREILSIPALNIGGDTEATNGELSGEESTARNRNGFVETKTLEESRAAMNGIVVHNPVVANGILQETSENVSGTSDLVKPTSESPLSTHTTVPPNTPQILIEDVSNRSFLSPEESDVTVYEKTPFGTEAKGHSRSSSGVKIVGAIEKTAADSTLKRNRETDIITVEKCTSKTYIVPESKPVAAELVASSVEVMSVLATPFVPNLGPLTPTVSEERPSDAVDGPTQPTTNEVAVNIPNGRSQPNVTRFRSDSETLASEGPDCEELLGGLLVRPCPSMRPFRKMFAKGFLVGLLIVIVAFIMLLFILNRT